MKKNISFLITGLLLSCFCSAQSLSPNVLGSAGGINQTGNLILDWTLGESAVSTLQDNDHYYTQGFHQPSLRVMGIQNENVADGYHILIAPNPVQSILSVKLYSEKSSKLELNLVDVNGKVISVTMADSKNDSKDIDMSNLASGMYLLNVINSNGTNLKTFRISKIQ